LHSPACAYHIDSEVSNGLIAQLSIINISGISTTGI